MLHACGGRPHLSSLLIACLRFPASEDSSPAEGAPASATVQRVKSIRISRAHILIKPPAQGIPAPYIAPLDFKHVRPPRLRAQKKACQYRAGIDLDPSSYIPPIAAVSHPRACGWTESQTWRRAPLFLFLRRASWPRTVFLILRWIGEATEHRPRRRSACAPRWLVKSASARGLRGYGECRVGEEKQHPNKLINGS